MNRGTKWEDFDPFVQRGMLEERMKEESQMADRLQSMTSAVTDPWTVYSKKDPFKRRVVRRIDGSTEIQVLNNVTRRFDPMVSYGAHGGIRTAFDRTRSMQDIADVFGIRLTSTFDDLPPTSDGGIRDSRTGSSARTGTEGTTGKSAAETQQEKAKRREARERRKALMREVYGVIDRTVGYGTQKGAAILSHKLAGRNRKQILKNVELEAKARKRAQELGFAYTGGTVADVEKAAERYVGRRYWKT